MTTRTAFALALATALATVSVPAAAQTTPPAPTGAQTESTATIGPAAELLMTADELDDIAVYGADGDRIGEIENVVVDAAGTYYIVLSVGGFFGIGDDDVAVPLSNLARRGDESLVLVDMTEDQLEALAEASQDLAEGYTVVDSTQEVRVRTVE